MQADDRQEEILLVDDNPDNLRLLAQMLGDQGYHLRFATSGTRALDSINLNPPDLLLLDIRMPELDGYEVCGRLKDNPLTREMPVIFISALDEVEDKVKAFAVGGVDYVTKPFQLEEVLARVQTHLALRRLQKDLQEANARMARELELAGRVQASFLPEQLPVLSGWQLAVSLIPARTTSGDFYDVIRQPDGTVGLVIADVSDKGVGAGLLMALSCGLLRTFLSEHPQNPEQVLRATNARLVEYTGLGQFVTVFLGLLNPSTGRFSYANAGHNPPVWHPRSARGDLALLKRTGLSLGVMEEAAWEHKTIEIERGDDLVLYTDGVTEAMDAGGDMFGLGRLNQIVCQEENRTAEALRDKILDSVYAFSGGEALSDDLALMILRRI